MIVPSLITQTAARTLKCQPPRNANQWARKNRVLPPDSAEPGEFRPERTPYIEAIAQAAESGDYERVVAMMFAQGGKTDLALNYIGKTFDDEPCPMLYVAPNRKLVESISRDRVKKLIRGCPSLSRKVAEGGLDNLTEKWIGGAVLRFIWASSATELSSHPAKVVILDEIDRMPRDVAGEGDPLTLAKARTSTYADRLIIIMSTPTVEGHSRIHILWKGGTALRWHWGCLGCGQYFWPCLELLKYQKAEDLPAINAVRLEAGQDAIEEVDKDTVLELGAWVECPSCKHRHYSHDREELNANGLYLGPDQTATIAGGIEGKPKKSTVASFWVNGLCSPFKTFEERAAEWIEAVKELGTEEDIKACLNTSFGQLFKVSGFSPEPSELDACKADYPLGEVQPESDTLTAGVDVQKDRLVVAVRGWGLHDESHQVWHGELWGDPFRDEVWNDLEELLYKPWLDAKGQKYYISRMAIDSQYQTDMVYSFCEKIPGVAMALDGVDGRRGAPISTSAISISPNGRKLKDGLTLWQFNKHYFRSWIYGRILRKKEERGRYYLSRHCSRQYCEELTAEERIVKPSGRIVWVKKKKHGDNHYLDAEVHARVAAHVYNVAVIARKKRRPPRKQRVVRRVR